MCAAWALSERHVHECVFACSLYVLCALWFYLGLSETCHSGVEIKLPLALLTADPTVKSKAFTERGLSCYQSYHRGQTSEC
jgi:hypothetical protein